MSEQHLAGGCLFGKVIDKGEEDPLATGRVFDTTNIYVADLSTVPLPRVSTQMTAYVIGHHVGKQVSKIVLLWNRLIGLKTGMHRTQIKLTLVPFFLCNNQITRLDFWCKEVQLK